MLNEAYLEMSILEFSLCMQIHRELISKARIIIQFSSSNYYYWNSDDINEDMQHWCVFNLRH